jgi:ABC-type dipeptide/oligopeptide/nickel transport system ATPase component
MASLSWLTRGDVMDEAALKVRELRTYLFLPDGVAQVLDGIDLSVGQGEIVGLVGESGAGKSLLLASILRTLNSPARVVGGEALFKGLDLLGLRETQLNTVRGREISFIGPNPHTLLNPLLPVGDQVRRFISAHEHLTPEEARRRVLDMFEAVGLPDPERRLSSYPHELSGGMAQRVVISIGLICSPTLLLADEPTFGLDVTIQAQVLEVIKALVGAAPGRGMLLVTRDLGIVANYCDSVYVLHDGRIVESSSVDSFFARQVTSYGRDLVAQSHLESRRRSRGTSPTVEQDGVL